MASGIPFPVVLLSPDPKMPLPFFFTLLETQLCFFPGTSIFQVSGPAKSPLRQTLRLTFPRLFPSFILTPTNQSLPSLTFTCARKTGAAGAQAYLGRICRKR